MNIEQRVFAIVAEPLGIDIGACTPHTRFENDLLMDSLDFIEFIMDLENEFDLDIDDETAITFNTLGDVVAYVTKATT